MNSGMRLEWLFARLSFQIAGALGGKPKWQDMIRYHEPAEEAKPLTDMDISAEAFAAMFGAKKKKE
jgi:hypothetical protein